MAWHQSGDGIGRLGDLGGPRHPASRPSCSSRSTVIWSRWTTAWRSRPTMRRTETKEEKVERQDRFNAQADRSHDDAPRADTRSGAYGAPPWVPGGTQATAARAHAPVQ